MWDDHAPDPDELWETLGRYVAGESDAVEAERVRRWLAAEPARAELLETLGEAVRRYDARTQPNVDVEAALSRVRARMSRTAGPATAGPAVEPPRRAPGSILLKAAAVAALALGGALVWRSAQQETAVPVLAARTWTTVTGQVDSVHLPDGSAVVLGPASQLTQPADFGRAARIVELEGEAWFDVTKDDGRPFTVRAGGGTIVDLGTAFVVRTGEDGVTVAVTDGAVRFGDGPDAEGGVNLLAGDRALLRAEGRAVVERGTVTAADVAWTHGRLEFEDASIARVAEDLRRWYGIELTWTDPSLAARRVTAAFEDEEADEVLDVVAAVLGVSVDRNGAQAVLRPLEKAPPR